MRRAGSDGNGDHKTDDDTGLVTPQSTTKGLIAGLQTKLHRSHHNCSRARALSETGSWSPWSVSRSPRASLSIISRRPRQSPQGYFSGPWTASRTRPCFRRPQGTKCTVLVGSRSYSTRRFKYSACLTGMQEDAGLGVLPLEVMKKLDDDENLESHEATRGFSSSIPSTVLAI